MERLASTAALKAALTQPPAKESLPSAGPATSSDSLLPGGTADTQRRRPAPNPGAAGRGWEAPVPTGSATTARRAGPHGPRQTSDYRETSPGCRPGFAPGSPTPKISLLETAGGGGGGAARKTRPSGRGRVTSPGSRASRTFLQTLPARSRPGPSRPAPQRGTRPGRGAGAMAGGGGRSLGVPRGEAGIPAWRTRGPSGPGTRRRRAPSVHRPRRRGSAFRAGGPQARLKIGASVTLGPAPADLALERRPRGETSVALGGAAAPGPGRERPVRPSRPGSPPPPRPGPSWSPAAGPGARGLPGGRRAVCGPRGRAPQPHGAALPPGAPGPGAAPTPRCPRRCPDPTPPARPYPARRGKETGKMRRRRHDSPTASSEVPPPQLLRCRRAARHGAGRPRHVRASGPAVPGDRPLKGTGVRRLGPRALSSPPRGGCSGFRGDPGDNVPQREGWELGAGGSAAPPAFLSLSFSLSLLPPKLVSSYGDLHTG